MNRICIFDTTLRDGEQTPGVSFSVEDKLEIANKLDELGVDVIEAGFPSASKGEAKSLYELAHAGLKSEICALTRTLRSDIDAAIPCEINSIHTFISTSDIQMKYALNMKKPQVLTAVRESIQYIKNHGFICEFSPMDATRTDLSFLKQVCIEAEKAGVDRLNIPDTVGIMNPFRMRHLITEISNIVSIPISVHCHNDFGMAVANSLAAVEGGASQVHVAVNGLGERAGNAALEEVVMALHLIYKEKTSINSKLLYQTSKLVSRKAGILIQPNKAIVGANAFAHESGIHTRGVTAKPLTFEPIKPELVGRKRRLIAGKLAGKHGIQSELIDAGITPDEKQLMQIVNRVKVLGDKGKLVTDADLYAIARTVMGIVEERIIDLTDFAVITGRGVIPTASVKLIINGQEYVDAGTGLGPVDAAINAIQRITDRLANVRLLEYHLDALTGGSDAVAEVVIKVEDHKGTIVTARGASEDVVMASVEAMINGINKLLINKKRKSI